MWAIINNGRTLHAQQGRELTIEVLKMTFATAAGREFLLERFEKQGLKIAVSLLEEMGIQIRPTQGQKPS
jgi:hypothetical protein